MKKCLHLKKTKKHWRRKPPKAVTWREKREAERKAALARMRAHPSNPAQLFAALIGEPAREQRDIDVMARVLGIR